MWQRVCRRLCALRRLLSLPSSDPAVGVCPAAGAGCCAVLGTAFAALHAVCWCHAVRGGNPKKKEQTSVHYLNQSSLYFQLHISVWHRIMDNRHHGEDVIAGWAIGGTIALAFFIRAASTADDVAVACGAPGMRPHEVQLSESGEGSDTGADTPLCHA